jgi:C1A family cysteine protease
MSDQHYYGMIPSSPDERDSQYHFRTLGLRAEVLPTVVDLRKYCSPIRDQGQLGSCTAEAMIAWLEFQERKLVQPKITLSVLFMYYYSRLAEGTETQDSGCEPRDVMKVCQSIGTRANRLWPYYISRFSKKPSDAAFAAPKYSIHSYHRMSSLLDVKTCLASGWPVYIGMTVYSSMESEEVSKTGVLPMPQPGEKVLGGHAVLIVGYNDTQQQFTIRNSWGKSWGSAGYFFMSYAYLTPENVSDLWTCQ